ncbi:Tryptophan halogenase [Fusarium solani]
MLELYVNWISGTEFNAHGFSKKNGAVFRLAKGQPDAYTDFLTAGGPDGYAWNLLRSEPNELLFRHAGACGAHIFDETKVDTVQFEQTASNVKANQPGRPVSATWTRKDGSSGSVSFEYLVDASGRCGILSTKYLQNRTFNPNFKNVANWGYWKSDKLYGVGTHMEGSPYFEGLEDASGWAWFMLLHDGTRSVGIVQGQKVATEKRQASGRPSTLDFYKKVLELAPKTKELLEGAELVSEIRSASEYSYTASTYHLPNARICGDAGCFIDSLFSSGVHLAITSGLSAAVTIMSSLRGDYDEEKAGSWHSKKTIESYTRFFLAEGFQRAFDLLRPIIQGTVDADSRKTLSRTEVSKVLEFCFRAFVYVPPEKKDALFEKLKKLGVGAQGEATTAKELEDIKKHLTPEES